MSGWLSWKHTVFNAWLVIFWFPFIDRLRLEPSRKGDTSPHFMGIPNSTRLSENLRAESAIVRIRFPEPKHLKGSWTLNFHFSGKPNVWFLCFASPLTKFVKPSQNKCKHEDEDRGGGAAVRSSKHPDPRQKTKPRTRRAGAKPLGRSRARSALRSREPRAAAPPLRGGRVSASLEALGA